MFISLVYAATVALLSLRSFASASPLIVGREGQGVWNPHITAPSEGDVWTVGSSQLVTWNTDDIPHYAKDKIGTLLLGYFDGSTREHLDTNHPLAEGFPLADGRVHIQVPDVKPRGTYIVVLMGNSGNASPEFRITRHSRPGMNSESFDKANPQKGSDDFDFKPASSNFVPVSPGPMSKDVQSPAHCKERHSGPKTGDTWSSTHGPASGEGRNRHC